MQALTSRNNSLLSSSRPTARPVTMRKAVVANASKIGKTNLVEKLAGELNLTKKQALLAVDTILDTIVDTVATGGEVNIPGFGSFKSRQRSARTGRNPKTGEALDIPASTVPTFSVGKTFKEKVKGAPASPPPAASGRKTTTQ